MEYKWTALTVTLVGTTMSGVNVRIVAVGLPTIGRQLHTGPEELIWLTQAFLLASIVCTVLVGRMGDLAGRIRIYNMGFAVFTVGAAFCTLSSNAYQVIAFRVIQGVGSAMILTNSTAIVTDASPPNELGKMLSFNSSGFSAGSMFGLTLSGLILSITNWRGLFFVNIPIGIFGTMWAHYRLREISTKDASQKMDWIGVALFTAGLLLTTLSITFLTYGVSDEEKAVELLSAGVGLLFSFVLVENKIRSPFVDLNVFRIRLFAAGTLAQFFNGITWTSVALLIAFYLQLALGYTALQAGLAIVPVEISYIVFNLISGRLSDKYGNALLSTIGLGIVFLGFVAMTTFVLATSYLQVATVLSLIGAGNGLFNSPNNRSIMSSVPANRRGVASAFRSLMFNTGALMSYGLVILFISFGISYNLLSQLIQQSLATSGLYVAKIDFINGFHFATYLLLLLDVAAIAMSIVRGQGDIRSGSGKGKQDLAGKAQNSY